MDFYIGLAQVIGVHSLLGLSAWSLLHTGQVSLAQGGFFAIGAYSAGIVTAMFGLPLGLALVIGALLAGSAAVAVGFPALRVKGLMLVVATTAFAEIVRLVFFNVTWRVQTPQGPVGPDGGLGFGGIRYLPSHGWTGWQVLLLIWALVALAMVALWWLDRARIGTLWRAVGEDEVAAQSAGINLTAAKVSAFGIGGAIAGMAGGLFAHTTTHIEHGNFTILLATFAIAYPILGGLKSLAGTVIAAAFIQGFLVEGLRFLGDWRSLLFGALILLVMLVRPAGVLTGPLWRPARGTAPGLPRAAGGSAGTGAARHA